MQLVVKIDAKARSSMLDDLEIGRVSEIDFLQGEIVRQAGILGKQAPANEVILEAVRKAFENGESPNLSGSEIRELLFWKKVMRRRLLGGGMVRRRRLLVIIGWV